jgi:hypothetical protein
MVCHGKCTQRLTLVTLNYSELMAYVKYLNKNEQERMTSDKDNAGSGAGAYAYYLT